MTYAIETRPTNPMKDSDWKSIKYFSEYKTITCTKRRWFGLGSEYESTNLVDKTDEEKDKCWDEMVQIASNQPNDVSVRIIDTVADMYRVVWQRT
jgi:hypothetical protein